MHASPTPIRSSDRVYEQLKGMAIAFAFRPGERLNEVELARRLAVSRTPLREALNRLAAEGFMHQTARGYVCRPLDAKQVLSLYELRQALETAIARHACARATDAELDELLRFVTASRDEPDDHRALRLLGLDEEFHERLAGLTRNDELAAALRGVNARIHFVRWIDMRAGRRRHTQAQHLAIVEALQAREAEAAAGLMAAHIARRLDQITEVIRAGFAEIYVGEPPR